MIIEYVVLYFASLRLASCVFTIRTLRCFIRDESISQKKLIGASVTDILIFVFCIMQYDSLVENYDTLSVSLLGPFLCVAILWCIIYLGVWIYVLVINRKNSRNKKEITFGSI